MLFTVRVAKNRKAIMVCKYLFMITSIMNECLDTRFFLFFAMLKGYFRKLNEKKLFYGVLLYLIYNF